MNDRRGPVLCPLHARQAAGQGQMPSGACEPRPSWPGGAGQTVRCDVAAGNGTVVAGYVAMVNTKVVPDPDDGGFVASRADIPGVFGQGETYNEAVASLAEAVAAAQSVGA